MLYYYGDQLSPNLTTTPEGFLICHNVPIARTGGMTYLARELQLDGDPDRTVQVTRSQEEVFDPAALASFEGKPVTDGHPPDEVRPDNYVSYARGHVQNVRRDGDYVLADLHIADPGLISQIQNKTKREVSCGYTCLYAPESSGVYSQTMIRGNHVAVVPNGRAGKTVSIKDSAHAEQTERGRPMSKTWTETLLSLFGMAAKDASPEAMESLTRDAAVALDMKPLQAAEPPAAPEKEPPAQDAPPSPAALPAAPPAQKPNGAEAKLDQILMLLSKMCQGAVADEEPDAKLGKAIDAMEGGAAEIIPSGEGTGKAAADSLAILKAVRPAVAAMQDREERNRVTDAILAAVNTGNAVPDMMDAMRKAAQQHAADNAPADNTAQQAAYDACNPHKKKEGN